MAKWDCPRNIANERKKQTVQNIKTQVKGKILTITVDLGKRLGPSKSGKTVLIASTSGNVAIVGGDGAVMGLNIYVPAGN